MTPIKTQESNFTYLGPRQDIADLPCRVEQGNTFSVWELTAEERALVADGANVRLGIYGMRPIPPVSLSIVANADCFMKVACPCRECGKDATDTIHGNGPDTHAFKATSSH